MNYEREVYKCFFLFNRSTTACISPWISLSLHVPQQLLAERMTAGFQKQQLCLNIWSTKLGGTVRATKKMTHNDYGPGPERKYGQTAIFTFFGQTSFFFLQKNTQSLLKVWYLFGKWVRFSLQNFARPWLEHGVQTEVNPFFGSKNSDFGPKFRFFAIGPPILSMTHW